LRLAASAKEPPHRQPCPLQGRVRSPFCHLPRTTPNPACPLYLGRWRPAAGRSQRFFGRKPAAARSFTRCKRPQRCASGERRIASLLLADPELGRIPDGGDDMTFDEVIDVFVQAGGTIGRTAQPGGSDYRRAQGLDYRRCECSYGASLAGRDGGYDHRPHREGSHPLHRHE